MLWYSAPLAAPRGTLDLPSRLRSLLLLALGVPLLLAIAHLLVAWALFAVAILLCGARARFARDAPIAADRWDWLIAAVTLFVAAPNVVHPPIDFDSVLYHLPNSVAWVQAHSLSPTWMRCWWYPGGSEITVAGIVAAGGLWVAGIASLLAAVMLSTRLYAWLREWEVAAATAAAIAIAFVTIPTVAFQTYDERNDLMLAAWFVETLWLLRDRPWLAIAPAIVMSLMKPSGWVYVIVAAVCMGRAQALIGLSGTALWALHAAHLKPFGTSAIGLGGNLSVWPTTIAANLPASLAVLAGALSRDGPMAVCCFLAPFAGLLLSGRHRRIAVAGLIGIALYAVTPYAYVSNTVQLATGHSLRYALPAIACGCLALAPLARIAPRVTGIAALIFATANVIAVFFVFISDGVVPLALAAPAIVVAVAAGPQRSRATVVACAILVVGLFLFGTYSASSRAPSFYADEMPRIDGLPSKFFAWFRQHPHDAEVLDLQAGKLLALAPHARITDIDLLSCERSATNGAWLVVAIFPGVSAHPQQVADVKRCGTVLFEDADVVVIAPSSSP